MHTTSAEVEETQAETTQNTETDKDLRGRGVQARPPTESVEQEFDEKLVIQDKPDPVIQDETTGLSSMNGTSIGGIKPENDTEGGLSFSTNIGKEEEKEESKTNGHSAATSEVSSGTPSAPKKAKTNKSKYFDSIDPEAMTQLMTELQEQDPDEFRNIMMTGKELLKCAEDNDVPGYHSRMTEAKHKNLLFWHTSKAFKKALDLFHKEMIEYILTTLQIDLSHEVFKYILHYFITRCMDLVDDAAQQRYAAEILELLLVHRRGIVNVDEIDPTHGDITAFQMTCFYGLYELAKKLMDEKADLNAVDNCGKTPLGLLKLRTIKAKLDGKTELRDNLEALMETMEQNGAVVDWRKADE